MKQDFFTPELTGQRFNENTVPLEVLADVSALQRLLIEVAKDDFKNHNGRQRVPRGFEDTVQVHLAAIEPGSAKLKLVLFAASLLPPYASHFERAQTTITQAIQAVQVGETPSLNPRYLSYFEKIGQNLKPDEAFRFPTPTGYAVLDQRTRKGLIEASRMQTWTDRAELRARVSSNNLRLGKFELHLLDGSALSAETNPHIKDEIKDAHAAYDTRRGEWLLLKCTVTKDRSGEIKAIDSIEDISPVDPLDVPLRLTELAALQPGWLDGEGLALDTEGLKWLSKAFSDFYAPDLKLPYVFPTPEGEVQAEWSIGNWSVTLRIDLHTKKAIYSALDLRTDVEDEQGFLLEDLANWTSLNDTLRSLGPESEEVPNI